MLDEQQMPRWDEWAGYPAAESVNDKGRPVNKKGKVLTDADHRRYLLQHGVLHLPDGTELKDTEVPAPVRAWKNAHPRVPGVTEPARLIQCPVCPYRYAVKAWFREHMAAHGLTPAQLEAVLAQLDGGGVQRLSVPWDEGDFLPSGPPPPVMEADVEEEAAEVA